jgi:signal transduction histidine kinase
LKEVRFAYIAGTSVLIFLFIVGLFEIISIVVMEQNDPDLMRFLHLTRGAVTVTVLLGWIAWTLYEFRDRFLTVVREHDTQYQRILEMSADAVLITDANRIVTYINPSALELLHRTREDTLQTDASAFIPFTEKSEIEWVHSTYRNQILNGTVTVLRKSTGEVESYLIVIRDLTERAMRQAQMERSERLASLGHMAAGVAHEIGNPLTAISSMVQLIQRKVTDSAQKEQLAQIRTNIGRITQIVRDLVDFSRPKPVEVAPVYAHVLVNEVIGLLRHDARCRNILFDTSGVRPVPVVNAVPDKLFQVLVNLILNAVDATLGNPAPVVRIHVQTASSGIEILVCDNGKGIPHELQTRIFEPFFTTKDVGKGTGQGLAIARSVVVDKHQGELRFDTRVGHGTTFYISPRNRSRRVTRFLRENSY